MSTQKVPLTFLTSSSLVSSLMCATREGSSDSCDQCCMRPPSGSCRSVSMSRSRLTLNCGECSAMGRRRLLQDNCTDCNLHEDAAVEMRSRCTSSIHHDMCRMEERCLFLKCLARLVINQPPPLMTRGGNLANSTVTPARVLITQAQRLTSRRHPPSRVSQPVGHCPRLPWEGPTARRRSPPDRRRLHGQRAPSLRVAPSCASPPGNSFPGAVARVRRG